MDKEFILNENTKSLVFVKDTEPAQVYLNGTLVEGMSAIKSNVQGTTEVTYNSEYKQNLMNMSVEGNTFQQTYTGKNLIDVDKFAELILSYGATAELFEVDGRRCIYFNNGQMHEKDFTSCCPNFKEKTRYIFSFECRPNSIMPEEQQYDGALSVAFKPSGTYTSKKLSAKTTTEFTRLYNINNANTTITDIALSYGSSWGWLIDLDTVYLYEYDGNDNPEYEQYVGRIPYPNVDCPQPIQNSSNVEVELRGDNVLISPSDFADTIDLGNYVKYDISTQVYDINLVKFGTSKSICHFDTPIPAGTKYTLLADVVNNDFEINYTLSLGLYKKDDTGTAWAGSTLDLSTLSQSNKIIYKTGVTTQPTTDIWLFKNYSENSYVKNLKVRFLVYFGEQTVTEWQPYFEPVTVQIPSEVTLADGTVVPLRFARLGTVNNNVAINKADTLTIDKIANKVTYTQYLDLFRPQAPYVAGNYNGSGGYGIRFSSTILQVGARQKGICTHGGRVGNYWSSLDIWLGVGTRNVYWLGIITYLGYNSDWVDKANPTTEEWEIAKEKMENYLAEQEANGTPFEVLYELPTPIEYDLTDTELGQQLLTLAKSTQNQTNTITVNSTLPISKLDVGYAIWGGRDES